MLSLQEYTSAWPAEGRSIFSKSIEIIQSFPDISFLRCKLQLRSSVTGARQIRLGNCFTDSLSVRELIALIQDTRKAPVSGVDIEHENNAPNRSPSYLIAMLTAVDAIHAAGFNLTGSGCLTVSGGGSTSEHTVDLHFTANSVTSRKVVHPRPRIRQPDYLPVSAGW